MYQLKLQVVKKNIHDANLTSKEDLKEKETQQAIILDIKVALYHIPDKTKCCIGQ